MTTQEPITSNRKSPNGFQHKRNLSLVCFPCIITIGNIANVGGLYDLIEFQSNFDVLVTKVKFLDSYVTGYRVTIVVLDIKTGEILKRSHRLNNNDLPCDWVLTDLFKSKPEPNTECLTDLN